MKSVAVIGGGITGLTTAFRLHQLDVPVTLYEASSQVGGPMRTIREKGYLAEFGPNTILETSSLITKLIQDLGIEHRRRDSNPAMKNNYIIRNGKMVTLPFSPLKLATTPLFSLRGKLRVALEPFIRANHQADDESLADFVIRRLGREMLDYAIDPFVAGIYAGDPFQLSVRHAFPRLQALEEKYGSLILGAILGAKNREKRTEIPKNKAKKVSFDEGLQVLTDALHAALSQTVKLNAEVTGLEKKGSEWSLSVHTKNGEEQHLHCAVILTAPAHKLAKLSVRGESVVDFSVLGKIHHPPVARVVFGFRLEDVGVPLNGFGFLVPKVERLNILGTTFSSSLFENRAPAGHVTLTTFLGGCRQPELATESSEKLFDYTLRDLQKILKISGKPTYQHHTLFPWAIPQYNKGYQEVFDFLNAIEEKLPGLFFAGNFRTGISAADCILAGHDMANRVSAYNQSLKTR